MATEKLSINQLKAVQLLTVGTNVKQITKICKIDPSTLWDWKQKPEFKAELERQKSQVYEEATGFIRGLVASATQELSKILVDPNTPPQTKLKCVELILNAIKPQQQQLDLMQAIQVLVQNNAVSPETLEKVDTALTEFQSKLKGAFSSQPID